MTSLSQKSAVTQAPGFVTKPEHLIRKHRLWRILEIIPGTLSWSSFLVIIAFSMIAPELVASFVIVYTLVWLFRSVKLSINLYSCFKLTQKALKTDWNRMIAFNDCPEKIDYELKKIDQEEEPKKYFELLYLRKQVQHLQTTNQWKKSKDIVHAIIFVTYKESYELIRESIKSYISSSYPSKKMIMVFAGEESDKENFLKISAKIQKEFGDKFMYFMNTIHPKNIPGEIKGKSANATWAAKELQKYLDKHQIAYDNVMVSNFDADTVTHKFYFSELTFKYLTTDTRIEKGYQPTPMFHNNIWDVPMMVRMVALACTYWRMAESMEKDKYKSFSSRSLSFQTTVDVNYWDPSVIPEDSRQFWTAYAVYDGRHRLVPIYSPLYMDAVLSETYSKTFKSQYSQLRRWAWGVCDFPFVALNLWYHPNIKFKEKIYRIYEFLKNSFFWATGPILITFSGFVPGFINPHFRDTVLAYNLPRIMSDILTLASSGIIMCAIISLIIVPPEKSKNWLARLGLCLQWLLVPIVSICLSSIPALDAQTRLMFGKYLEYKVTEKARKN
ncbi:hypothetical protein IT413_06525 [Candidatus Peregrinibacteria bacterium]|nr:hypothetical protein [Candidatus Peregrinibacteria bacterium]